ncbi:hypothetical protein [Blastomonas sp. SL216]|uniref:hypothetical protein n=1 Tax=Blastomonas sp. SL216 TaxID=2995169 RepID=UPI002377CEDD|nr:hypothetical protein OU999_17105 [Blastomonas sp. SL216]
MSGRSCSIACAVFFARDAAAIKEPPQCADPDVNALRGVARLILRQRDIAVLDQHRHNPVSVNIGLRRALIAARLAHNRLTMLARHSPPANRRSNANPQKSRCCSATHIIVSRRNDPVTQILR